MNTEVKDKPIVLYANIKFVPMGIINKIKRLYQSIRFFVVIDPSDNSVTLSKKLFAHLRKTAGEGKEAKVFVFRVTNNKESTFAFMVNPDISQETQLCDIQYNDKHKCVGFETLCPSVGFILYEYGLPAIHKCKLSVTVRKTELNTYYYQIEKPTNSN